VTARHTRASRFAGVQRAGILVALLCAPALAGPPAFDRATVSSAPRDASMIVLVNDAAAQLEEPAARVGVRVLEEANLLTPPVREAWGELASSLGWDEHRALKELLGRRFAFLERYEDRGGLKWAVVTLVSDRARARILRKLDLAPRERLDGRVVNVGEGGGFLVAIGPSRDGWSFLLLAERESKDLFRKSLPMLTGTGGPDALAANPAFARVRLDVDADAIVILNDHDAATVTTIAVERTPTGYDGRIVLSPADPDRLDMAAAWSPEMLERLDDRAIGVILGVLGPGTVRSWFLRFADEILGGFAERLATRFGGRVALVVESEEGAVLGTTTPTLGLSAALETNDVFRAALELDAAMADAIPRLEQLGVEGAPVRDAPNYRGELYEAVRVEPVQGMLASTLAGAIGPDPAFTWVGRHWGPATRDDGPPEHLVARTGWWCVGAASGGTQARLEAWPVQRLCEALASEQVGERPTHRVLGVLRPARFVDWLVARRGDARTPTQIRALAWIEEIRWSLEPDQGGVLTGELSITLDVDALD